MRKLISAVALSASLLLVGCGEKPTEAPVAPEQGSAVEAPEIVVESSTEQLTFKSSAGESVTLNADLDDAQLVGVTASVSTAFDGLVAEVRDDFVDDLEAQVGKYDVSGLSGVHDVTFKTLGTAVTDDWATVSFTSGSQLTNTGTFNAHSVTVDLATGEEVALDEVLDVGDARTAAALQQVLTDDCFAGLPPAGLLTDVAAWSPAKEGIQLTWSPSHGGLANACGTQGVFMPWPDLSAPAPEKQVASALTCEQILPITTARAEIGAEAVHGDTIELMFEKDGAAQLAADTRVGPSARAAYAQATSHVFCGWASPVQGGLETTVDVAALPDTARDQLLAELRASDYVESEYRGIPVFTYDDGVLRPGPIRYAFVGDYLVHEGMIGTERARAAILDGVEAASQ